MRPLVTNGSVEPCDVADRLADDEGAEFSLLDMEVREPCEECFLRRGMDRLPRTAASDPAWCLGRTFLVDLDCPQASQKIE